MYIYLSVQLQLYVYSALLYVYTSCLAHILAFAVLAIRLPFTEPTRLHTYQREILYLHVPTLLELMLHSLYERLIPLRLFIQIKCVCLCMCVDPLAWSCSASNVLAGGVNVFTS